MNSKTILIALAALILGIGATVIAMRAGSGGGATENIATTDSHAGHNHAPGEGHDAAPGNGHDQASPDDGGHSIPGIADWCAPHRVPESACTKCNTSLIQSFKDKNDWCVEHGLPESHCRLCNPGIEFPQERALRALQPAPELGVSVFFPANLAICATTDAVIQFASTATFDRAGFTVQPVSASTLSAAVEAPAEVVFNQSTAVMLTLPVRASIVHWLAEPGQVVREGQMLALGESPDVGMLKGEYLEAAADAEMHEKDLGRQDEMHRRNLTNASTLEVAQAETKAAQARKLRVESQLKAIGLTTSDLDEVRGAKLSSRFAVRAPSSGTLVERDAPIGVALEEGTHLATIADPSDLWIEARVRDTDLSRIRTGQHVEFTSDGGSLERVDGRVIWVSPMLNADNRTGVVRAEPVGDASSLRAHQFGHLDIMEDTEAPSVLVPRDAVQWEGCCHVVFVREAEDRYRPRKVTLAKGDSEHYRVLSGLSPDDWVVVQGSFLLKTEIKKSSIGAGCCGLDAKS